MSAPDREPLRGSRRPLTHVLRSTGSLALAALWTVWTPSIVGAEPVPELGVDAPSEIRPGHPFQVVLRGTNTGTAAHSGSLTVSLPGSQSARVAESTLPGGTRVFEPGEQMFNFGLGRNAAIQNRAVELFVQPWAAGQSHSMRIEVVTSAPILVMARNTLLGSTFITSPPSGPPDQQGAPVRSIELVPAAQQRPTEPPPTPAPPTPVPATPVPPTPVAPTSVPLTPVPSTPAPTVVAPTPPPPTPSMAPPSATAPAPAVSAPTAPTPRSGDGVSMPLLIAGVAVIGAGLALGLVALGLSLRHRPATNGPISASELPGSPAYVPTGRVAPTRPIHDDQTLRPAGTPWDPRAVTTGPLGETFGGPRGEGVETAPGKLSAELTPAPDRPGAAMVAPQLAPELRERYQNRTLVGRGGMGSVYRAWDTRLRRWVALKVMHGDLSLRPAFLQRFLREAQTAAMLEHPNIVTIHDVDQIGDEVHIVMAWIEGEDLQKVIQREGALPLGHVSHILTQVAAALDHAHQQPQLVHHRDVKPANIMLGPSDRVVLTDFGIAKLIGETSLTAAGQVVGTPDYMAPEVVRGEEADHRADLYSLGVVLYEMVAGRTPFRAETPLAVLHAQLYSPPPSPRAFAPDIPEHVEKVILRAIAKEPSLRFQTATGLARAFESASAS